MKASSCIGSFSPCYMFLTFLSLSSTSSSSPPSPPSSPPPLLCPSLFVIFSSFPLHLRFVSSFYFFYHSSSSSSATTFRPGGEWGSSDPPLPSMTLHLPSITLHLPCTDLCFDSHARPPSTHVTNVSRGHQEEE